MTEPTYYPGEWCDVDHGPGGFIFARLEQPGVIRLMREAVESSHTLGRWGLYLRAAVDGQGNVCCVLQDGRDRNPATGDFWPAIVVLFPRDGEPREIACPAGPAWGQNAVEVTRDRDGWTVSVVTGPAAYWVGELSAAGEWGLTGFVPWAPTSQGFADRDHRMDDVRASVPGMVCPSTVDGLSIGQAGPPDRIRGLHAGVYFTAIPGTAFEPHLASDGQGRWLACARTPQGAALVALAPPFEAEEAPPAPPDVPWTPDPTRTVDMLDYVKAAASAYVDIGNGRGRCWLHKSPERFDWGENWDHDADYIGFEEDRSTGTRMVTLPEPRPKRDPWTNTTRDRWSPEQIVAWNTAHPDRPVGDYRTLPLAGYTWNGNRVWMVRRATGRAAVTFTTRYDWWDLPEFGGRWELHPPQRITAVTETGYARWNGHDVLARTGYLKPNGDAEWNYWGPHGWIAFRAYDRHGVEVPGTAATAPAHQRASPLTAPFVLPRRLPTYPIYDPAREPEKEPEMTTAEAVARARYVAPYDIVEGARNAFKQHVLARDVQDGRLSDGAERYFGSFYYPTMAAQQVEHGVPGSAEGWGHYSVQALRAAQAAYDRDQRPGEQPPPGILRGPIGISERDFTVPEGME